MAFSKVNYARVRSNGLAIASCDPVSQHMQAWRLYQHDLKILKAKPWEIRHVNPGRKARTSSISEDQLIPARSFSRLSLQPTTICRAPSSLRSLQPTNKKSVRISYSAHLESHKKFEKQESTFKPKILETPAKSRLVDSRNYQPPKRKTAHTVRIGSANSAASSSKSAGANNLANSKTWSQRRSESVCSSSTGCDSAYEAGGSIEGLSPQSRGSTPEPNAAPIPASPNEKRTVTLNENLEPELLITEDIEETIERPTTPICLLDRNESLDYILFEHDLMNEIATAGVVTNASVKEVCRIFVAAHSKNLDSSKVEDIVKRVKCSLGIPESDSFDLNEYGLFTCTENPARVQAEEVSNQGPLSQ